MAVEFKTVTNNYEVSVESENTELKTVICSICELNSDKYVDEDTVGHNIISISSIVNNVKSHNDPEVLPSDIEAIKAFRELMLTPYESFDLNRLEIPIINIFNFEDIECGWQIFKSVFLQLKGDVSMFIIPQSMNSAFKCVYIYKWNTKELPEFNLDFIIKISLIKYPNHVNLLNLQLPVDTSIYCNIWPNVLK